MGTALSVIRARVRREIPEANEVEWPDERLDDIVNLEYRKYAAELRQLPGPGWFTTEADVTLPANTTAYDLTDAIEEIDGEFSSIKSVWYRPPDGGDATEVDSVSPGHEEMIRLGPNQSPVGQCRPLGRWLSRPGGVPTLNLHPESSVARDFRVYLGYTPPLLVEDEDELQTDPLDDDIIVRRATLRALEEAGGEDDPVIGTRAEKDEQKAIARERNSAGEFTSETTKVVVSEGYFGGG